MKRKIIVLLILLLAICFCGALLVYYSASPEPTLTVNTEIEAILPEEPITGSKPADDKILSESPIELTMLVEDVTPVGAKLMFTHTDSSSLKNFQTGSWYQLEKEVNGEWQELDYVLTNSEIAWTDEAWIINKDSETEFEENWEWLYGKLETGKYRITKEVMDLKMTGDYDTYTLTAQFVLE